MNLSQISEFIKQHQKTIPISVAGVVVAGGLLAVGVLAYQGQHAKSSVAKSAASPTPTEIATSSVGASVTPTPDTTKYLVISELGIKLPLTSSIYDLVYTYSSDQLYFSTTSISSIPNSGFTCDVNHAPLGIYNVYSSAQSNVGSSDNQVGDLVANVNNKYIYYHHVQYACGETPSEQAAVINLIDPLHTAVQNAKPIQ